MSLKNTEAVGIANGITMSVPSSRQRRHYSPRSVYQQYEQVPEHDEQVSDAIDDTESRSINVNESYLQANNVSLNFEAIQNIQTEKKIRTLGGLEHMYSVYTMKGAEVICLMTAIDSIYEITEKIAHKAFLCLMQRHPLLRLSISKDPSSEIGELKFTEKTPVLYDFQSSERTDWMEYLLEEASRSFTGPNLPLFRFRLLNSSPLIDSKHIPQIFGHGQSEHSVLSTSATRFRTRFLFVVHHSIMDGGYILWSFQEYVNFVDAIATGKTLGKIKELPVLEPAETMLSANKTTIPEPYNIDSSMPLAIKSSNSHKFSIEYSPDATTNELLLAYKQKYDSEIKQLSRKSPRNGCMTFSISPTLTNKFVNQCKAHQCTPKAAICSVWMFALLELLYGDLEIPTIDIPFEYMVDLRRCNLLTIEQDDVPHYPGLASAQIPMAVKLQGGNLTKADFWEFASIVDTYLSDGLIFNEMNECIRETQRFRNKTKRKINKGKCPYVLCISNMGKLDGVLDEDVGQRVHLAELSGHSTILMDDMPVFFVTTFLLNGQLQGNVSFCESFTSNETSRNFIALMQKNLGIESKL